MTVILALVTIVALILISELRKSRRPVVSATPVLVKRYVHPGHAWVRETEDGDVLVGIDDFAQSLIGSVDGVEFPPLLRKLEQGSQGWRVKHGPRIVPIVSPVSGRVIEKNEMVMNNPGLVNASPYGDGWLLRVKPRRLPAQLHNLLTGKAAQQWLDLVRAQLSRFFSGTPALMYQDGGVMLENLSDRCSDEEWNKLVKEFFLIDEHTPQL